MSEFQKQSFEDRLAKLEAKKAADRSPSAPEYQAITREKRSVWPFVLLGFGLLGVITAIVLSLTDAPAVVKTYAQKVLTGFSNDNVQIAAVATPDINSSVYPFQRSTEVATGQGLGSGLVASIHGTAVPLEMLIDLNEIAQDDGSALRVAQFERESRCVARPVMDGEVVYSVNVEQPSAFAPLFARDDASAGQSPNANRLGVGLGSKEGPQPRLVNVFVSDTSGPLYLVLQSFHGVIWNISPSKDVEIAHITLIGQDSNGVANLPEGTTVNAIRVSDFVAEPGIQANDAMDSCMVKPWRRPQTNWPSFEGSVVGAGSRRDLLRQYQRGQAAYQRWFEATFGESIASNERNVFSAHHVLVGSVYEDVRYWPLKGARVWVDAHTHEVQDNH